MSDTSLSRDTVFTDPLANGASGDLTPAEILAALPPDGFQDIDPLKHDFSYLNEGREAFDDEYDPNATLEEETARKAAKAERIAAEKAEAEKPTPEPEEKPDAAPDKVATEKVEMWDKFADTFEKSPEVIAQIALKAMSDTARTALLKSLGIDATATAKAPALPDLPDDYEPIGDLEVAMKARWGDVKAIPELRQQIADLQSSLDERMGSKVRELHNPIGTAAVHSEIALAKLDVILEALGIDLPSPDMNTLNEILQDGRTNFRSAVQKLTKDTYKKSLAEYRQGKAQRPNTPGTSSTHAPSNSKNTEMAAIIRELGGSPAKMFRP